MEQGQQVEKRNGLYGFEYREKDLRRVNHDEKKTYNIKALWQVHHEIVNLAARGFKQVHIAKILNIDPQTVSNALGSELGELKLSEIRKSRDEEAKVVSENIRVLTDKALKVYHEIFDNDSGEVSLMDKKDAAKDVITDLSGLRSPLRIHSSSTHTILTSEELKEFQQRAIKAARDSGMIVEIEGEMSGQITESTADILPEYSEVDSESG